MPATVEATFVQEADIYQQTMTAAVAAGEIIQNKNGKAGQAMDAYAAGAVGHFRQSGHVWVLKSITQTMLISNQVFWDSSASKCNLLHGGDVDFFLGTVVEDAAYTDTLVKVDLNAKPAYTLAFADGFVSVPISTAGWPHTGGAGANGWFGKFDLAAEAQKLDALGLRALATATPGILQFLICVNLNGDAASADFNFGLADGTNATNADTITSSLFVHLDGASQNITIESDNAAAEVASTDTTLDFVDGTPFLVTWDLRDWSAIKCYVNGLRVGDGTTGTLVALTLAGVAGPLRLLAHMEKDANDTPGNVTVMDAGFTSFNV